MEEISETQKKQILKDLVNDEEIIMLFDDMNNCYRPLWKNEWDTQQDVKNEVEAENDIEKYKPYIATENDISTILDNGSLEWENDGKNWYVKIWW